MKCIIENCDKKTNMWFLIRDSSSNLFCKDHAKIYDNEMSKNDKLIDEFVAKCELDVIKKINVDKQKLKTLLDKSKIEVSKIYYAYINENQIKNDTSPNEEAHPA